MGVGVVNVLLLGAVAGLKLIGIGCHNSYLTLLGLLFRLPIMQLHETF